MVMSLRESLPVAYLEGYADNLIRYRESEFEFFVFLDGFLFQVLVIDVFFHHDRPAIVIPMPVGSVMSVTLSMVVPFSLCPAAMISTLRLVVKVIGLVITICKANANQERHMKNQIIWLRISYWVGAITDGFATFRMLTPKMACGVEYRYALGLGASLMLGWTFLLIWADRKPLERKGVLLLTAFPVVTGILLAEIYAVATKLISLEEMAPMGLFLVALIALFSFSYFKAPNV